MIYHVLFIKMVIDIENKTSCLKMIKCDAPSSFRLIFASTCIYLFNQEQSDVSNVYVNWTIFVVVFEF